MKPYYLEIPALLLLLVPLAFELYNERQGEHKSNKVFSTLYRLWQMFVLGGWAVVIRYGFELPDNLWWPIMKAILLSFAIHFMVFDYAMNVILNKRNPFEYLGKTAWLDMWSPWVKIGPWGRFTARMMVLAVALILYF